MLRCKLKCNKGIIFHPEHFAVAEGFICNAKNVLHGLSNELNKRRFWDKKGLCNGVALIVSDLA